MRRYARKSLETFAHFSNTHRDLAALGKTQMRLRARARERRGSTSSFGIKREGEMMAIQGMVITIACVCAVSFALGIGANNNDRGLATLEGERAPLM